MVLWFFGGLHLYILFALLAWWFLLGELWFFSLHFEKFDPWVRETYYYVPQRKWRFLSLHLVIFPLYKRDEQSFNACSYIDQRLKFVVLFAEWSWFLLAISMCWVLFVENFSGFGVTRRAKVWLRNSVSLYLECVVIGKKFLNFQWKFFLFLLGFLFSLSFKTCCPFSLRLSF